MSMAAVAIGTAAVGVGGAIYSGISAHNATNAAQNRLSAVGQMPGYQPLNLEDIQKQATQWDQQAYARSDKDFAARHPELLQGMKMFEAQTMKDQMGNTELMPQLQNEMMRAGLSNALGSFGDIGSTLAPGSAGEADVARNLGMGILQFQQLNRQNRQQSLTLADQLFPHRQFGLTGVQGAQMMMQNNQGQNAWNQANYANRLGMAQAQNQIAMQGTQMQNQAIASGISSLSQAGGMYGGYKMGMAQAGQGMGTGQGAVPEFYTPGSQLGYNTNNMMPVYRGINLGKAT